jgi:hypothetical protein
MSDESLTVEALFARAAAAVQPIAALARDVVVDELPEPIEVVRAGNNAVYYGKTEKYLSSAVYIMPHKKHVNLGFFKGAHLEDPTGLLEGTGKNLRHVKLKQVDAVDTPAIRALLRNAWNIS